MDPITGSALISAGSNLFGSIFGGDTDPYEELNKALLEYRLGMKKKLEPKLFGELETPAVSDADLESIFAQSRRGAMPAINNFAAKTAAKYGSRSGYTGGLIGEKMAETFGSMMPQLSWDQLMANNNKKMNVYRFLEGLGG